MQTALALPVPSPVPAPVAPPPIARSKVTPPKPVAAKESLALTGPNPSILFGLDQRGRAHAARFVGRDAAALERAADLMDLFLIVAETDALRDLGTKLPAGRLFPASGKALAPFCSGAIYQQLLAAAGITHAPRPVKAAGKAAEAGGGTGGKPSGASGGSGAGDPPATRVGAKAPADHAQIGIGSLVLAQGDDEADEGYYAAKVIATKSGDGFILTWAEYPDLPEFSRAPGAGAAPPRGGPGGGVAAMAGVATLSGPARVRALNDAFRRSFTGGRVVVTAGVAALPEAIRAAVLAAVRAFDRFDSADDPYGEHDFGAVTVGDTRCFWKIDAYDRDLRGRSPDPADPAVTVRVLTVMLAEEY